MSLEHRVAGKYARALLMLAQEEGKQDELRADLELVSQLFGSGQGRDLLVHPLLPLEKKEAAVRELVSGKVSVLTLSLLRLLIEKRRGALVSEIAAAYAEELLRLQGRRSATVVSSLPLDAAQVESLRKKLASLVGAEIDLSQVTDPGLRGGARITLGDLVIDGTIGGRLDQLRRALAKEKSQEN